ACGESSLPFKSAMDLIALLKNIPSQQLTAERLMAYLQFLPASVIGYTPLFKRGRSSKEPAWQRDVSTYYGSDVTQSLQRGAYDQYEYWGRCKRAAILWEWIQGYPIRQIEEKYSTTPYGGNIGGGE